MSNNCIKCNREIEKSQKVCLICGASQNYFSHYFTTVVVFLVLLGGVAGAGYWYENRPEKMAELNRLRSVEVKAEVSLNEIENLTNKNTSLNKQLQEIELQLKTEKESVSLNNQSELEKNQQLEKQSARAVKAEQRASWLSKQNNDFKTEINSLKEQLSALQATPDILPEDPMTPIISDTKELTPATEKTDQEQPVEVTSDSDKN